MWRLLLPFGILALLSGVVIWLADNPGTVTVLWRGYEIRTSFVTGLFAVSLTTFFVLLGYRLFATFMKSPAGFTSFLAARKRRKGYEALSKGLVAIAAGDAREGTLYAAQARKLLDEPAMTLLLGAQAAQLNGDAQGATKLFEEMREFSETEFLGLRGLYVQADRAGDKKAALFYAEKAFQLRPKTRWAADATFSLQVAAHDFAAATQTLDKMLGAKLVTRDVGRRRRAVLLTAEAMAMEAAGEEIGLVLSRASEASELEPQFAPSVALTARLMAANGQMRKASRLIERAWAGTPHPVLADVYLTLDASERAFDRLRRVKGLVARKPGAGESQMVLARAALAARDFETARSALEPLLDEAPSQTVCALMAELESASPSASGGRDIAREWLTRALHARPDPCWIATGYQSNEWVAVVPETGAFDALVWQAPVGRSGVRPALVPLEAELDLSGDAQIAQAPDTDQTPQEDDNHVVTEEAPVHTNVPEHIVVAPDDPGPEGADLSNLENNGDGAGHLGRV
jgi:HemY protein